MLSVPYAVVYSEGGSDCLLLAFEDQEIYLYIVTGYDLNGRVKMEVLDKPGYSFLVNVEPITKGEYVGKGFRVVYDAASARMFGDLFSGVTTDITIWQWVGDDQIQVSFNVEGLPQFLASNKEYDAYADLIQCVISMGKYGN